MIEQLLKRYEALKGERTDFEKNWQRVADLISPIPRSMNLGTKAGKKLPYNSVATESAEQLVHTLNGSLTNPSTDWFKANVNDADLIKDYEVQQWFEAVTTTINHYLQQSNFGEAMSECYRDLVLYGTAGMLIEPDEVDKVSFSCRNVSEFSIAENHQNKVDTVFRLAQLTARQAVQRFGEEKLTKQILKVYKDSPDSKVEILHIICPRKDHDKTKLDKKNKPIASYWVCMAERKLIDEGGYEENPMPVARWSKLTGDVYGYSPSMSCITDVIVLQEIEKISLLSKQLAAMPPVFIEDDSLLNKMEWAPGMRIVKRKGSNSPAPLQLGQQPQLADSAINDKKDQIRRTYFADIIMNRELKYVTAEGINQNADERERILTSILGRLQSELLEPLVTRVFNILYRAKVFPPAPKQLSGKEWHPVWTSPLARKQLERKGDGITKLFQVSQLVAPFFSTPTGNSFVERFDADKVSAALADIYGLNALIKSDYVLAQERQAKAQASQQQMATQQLLDAAPGLAQAELMTKDTNGPIGNLLRGMQ